MKYEEGNVPAFCGECGTKLEEVKTTPEEKVEEATETSAEEKENK